MNGAESTVNAAATAIVSAESRIQQQPTVQKRRWGGCWSLYWCFGSQKSNKRIGHAVLVPEQPEVPGAVAPSADHQTPSTALVFPFIAPPSSPASFLQSDPPSATHTPAGFLSLTSLTVNSYSPSGPANIFAIGPYAHETQLVTPPVFSAFTTQPSTAPFTPPPESVQLTTPSSPEVPFAQLLTSSLERARRNSGTNQKFSLSHYEFHSYHLYPGSPGGQLISPGSVISNSGTSSPFPDRHPIFEIRMGEARKLLGIEHFATRKWGSRLPSGSVTPDGLGLGSRLGSGCATPDGVWLVGSGAVTPDVLGRGSRLGSGAVTPDVAGLRSSLGSGSLTPDCVGPASHDGSLLDKQISGVACFGNGNGYTNDEIVVNHRVSFELSGEEVARCLQNKSAVTFSTISGTSQDANAENDTQGCSASCSAPVSDKRCLQIDEVCDEILEKPSVEMEEQLEHGKHCPIRRGSSGKEFKFDNSKGEVPEKQSGRSEWWANERISTSKGARHTGNWSFFPFLQSEVS